MRSARGKYGVVKHLGRVHLAAQPQGERLVRRQQPRCEQQVGDSRGSYQVHKALHLLVSNQEAQLRHRQPKVGVGGGDAQVAVRRQQQPAAYTKTVDQRQRRLGQRQQGIPAPPSPVRCNARPGCDCCAVPGTRRYRRPALKAARPAPRKMTTRTAGSAARRRQISGRLAPHGIGDGIVLLRPIQSQRSERRFDGKLKFRHRQSVRMNRIAGHCNTRRRILSGLPPPASGRLLRWYPSLQF